MKKFKRLWGIGFFCLTAIYILSFSANAQQHLPGANFWGDSDNTMIDNPDMGAMELALVAQDPGYWDITDHQAPGGLRSRTSLWQDLDGNGFLDGPDYAIIQGWLVGDFSDLSGDPISLDAELYALTVDRGDSVTVQANALSGYGNLRPGWGVVYEILGTSTWLGRRFTAGMSRTERFRVITLIWPMNIRQSR